MYVCAALAHQHRPDSINLLEQLLIRKPHKIPMQIFCNVIFWLMGRHLFFILGWLLRWPFPKRKDEAEVKAAVKIAGCFLGGWKRSNMV